MNPGGMSPVKEADAQVKKYCDEVKEEVRKLCDKTRFVMYEPIKYNTQVVAGTMYYVKIVIEPSGECIHAKILEELPGKGGTIQLEKIETNKTPDDPVQHF